LSFRPVDYPRSVWKHEDVWPGYLFAFGALRQDLATHLCVVHDWLKIIVPNFIAFITLQVMDAAVNLVNFIRRESCFLELAINVWSHDKDLFFVFLFIVEHDLKSLVGLGFAVHFKARTIKAPEKIGLFE
jgi:hypothetical protein